MSRRRVLGVVAVAALMAGLAWPAHATAADAVAVGWWTRNPGQSAPAGGMAVSSAPDGAVSVSAIRIDVGAGVISARISAGETGGVAQASAPLRICPTVNSWTPAEGGALADAPPADCAAGEVDFVRDADAASWSADVSNLVGGAQGVVSLAVVPGESSSPLAPTFDVRLAAPTVESTPLPIPVEVLDPTAGSGSWSGDDGSAPASGASFDFESSPATDGPGFTPGGFSGSATPDPAAPEPPTAPDADTDEAPVMDDLDEFAVPPLVPTSSSETPNHRTVGKALTYVLLSALAGVVVGGGSRIARVRSLA